MEEGWTLADLKEWTRALMRSHRVVAPVAGPRGAVWGEVKDPDGILWDYGRTMESPRSWLIPRIEPLFAYDLASDPPTITELPIEAPPTALLLLRSCDVAGLRALDPVMRTCTPHPMRIEEVRDETPDVKTLKLRFLDPAMQEGFTFRAVGKVTEAIRRKDVGDVIGFRGPYGNNFPLESFVGKDLLFVIGGIALPQGDDRVVDVS